MEQGTETIIEKIYIPAKPLEVYKALTDPEQHAEFTGARVTGDAKVGGTFTALNEYILGKYLDLEEGKRILQEWQTDKWPKDHLPSILELSLAPFDEGTELRVVHAFVPKENVEVFRVGWFDFYWNPLKTYFNKV